MKFKNVSGKMIPVKLGNCFVDVQADEIVESKMMINDERFEKVIVEEPKVEEPKVEEPKEVIDVSELDEKSKDRVEDIVEDLADDGKRNRSNKKKAKKKK